jgi:hypothetical protein
VKLTAWEALRERRQARWWTSRWLIACVAGAAIAAIASTGGPNAHLACALGASAFAFMRVPFHIYWRADAALLAQLPIDGTELFAAALRRCVRAAAATMLALVIGALPLTSSLARELAIAGALGVAAACLLPAVATFAAMIVAAAPDGQRGNASAILGALPGFASAGVVVVVILACAYDQLAILGALAAASIVAIAAVRVSAPRMMATILRDVSALDRQRLAKLEIHPPTAIERLVGKLVGRDAALAYGKDARLVRRRYPMAFALGSFAFVALVIVGLARPDDPAPWLGALLGGGVLYGAVLAERLRRPPIELPRLSATLPISPGSRRVAKLAWTLAWAVVYLAVPGAFALVRLR